MNLGVAMVLSFLIPGLGQLYRQQVFAALVWFVICCMGYVCFIVPGLILHLFCIIAAGMRHCP
jgi:TM2 domain-containing membrane protein YozV